MNEWVTADALYVLKCAGRLDVELLNRRAGALNAEAEDVLGYQSMPDEACGRVADQPEGD